MLRDSIGGCWVPFPLQAATPWSPGFSASTPDKGEVSGTHELQMGGERSGEVGEASQKKVQNM